jgi:hypothetical protein
MVAGRRTLVDGSRVPGRNCPDRYPFHFKLLKRCNDMDRISIREATIDDIAHILVPAPASLRACLTNC